MTKKTDFKDFNFKLAVIEVLMYRDKLLSPAFDVAEFIQQTKGRKLNLQKEGYKVIPGVKKYFKDLVIPPDLLGRVESIHQGYHTAYHQIIPFWDGEGDEFNITSTEDLNLVPNLKEIVLLYDHEQKMVREFEAKGIKAQYL
jgi:hypothetical protein